MLAWGLTRCLSILRQGNREPLVMKTRMQDPRWASGEQVLGFWVSIQCSDTVGQERHPVCKKVAASMLVCWWWRFDRSFALLVTSTSIILVSLVPPSSLCHQHVHHPCVTSTSIILVSLAPPSSLCHQHLHHPCVTSTSIILVSPARPSSLCH